MSAKRISAKRGLSPPRARALPVAQPVFRSPMMVQRKCACGGGCSSCAEEKAEGLSPFQTKLTVNTPGDAFEQEADRVAEQVTRMSAPSTAPTTGMAFPVPGVQRMCSCGGSCDKCQAEQGYEDEQLQMKSAASVGLGQIAAPHIVHAVLRSTGQPLDPATRAFMEPRLGYAFSGVRVHVDAQAAESARAVNARAYTVGHQIVFGLGQYEPATARGARLIAHELAHVVQQARSVVPSVQRDEAKAPPTIGPAPEEATSKENEIERRWKQLKRIASGFDEIKGWISAGDAVVALMLEHEMGYYKAIHARDAELAATYQSVIDTDIVAYRYVAWHTFVYQNLLRARSEVNSLVSSFDADKRNFTGRQFTEERVRALKELINAVGKDSALHLATLTTNHPYKFRAGTPNEVLITVTSAADKNKRAALDKETREITNLEVTVEAIADNTNKFLRNATKEGFWQAVEAVKEYIEVRRGIVDSDNGPDADDSKKSDDPAGGGSGSGQSESEKSEEKRRRKKKNKSPDYQCTAKCQQQCPTGVEGWSSGTSNQNCGEATRNAKSLVRQGCYPRHCNCKDTDGFRGEGHACESHTR